MTGSRSYYRDGYKLVTLHRPGTPYDDSEWALYDIRTDPTEIHDLSDAHPELVKELAAAWEAAAWRNGVFPLQDASDVLALRGPAEEKLGRPVTLLPGTPELERYRSSRLIAFRSFAVTVELDSYEEGDAGVLVSHGDQGGGYSLYIEDGRLRLAYNEYGALRETDAGPLLPDTRTILLTATAEPGLRRRFALSVDGTERALAESVHQLIGIAPFQGISVGVDRKSPVSWPLYERHGVFRYPGTLRSVTYRPGAAGPDSPAAVAQALRDLAAVFE
ncbi:hypothetical protein [Streptomyces malaysiensis]|uniref:hypothetical protein n=1 Tax=Streptomyces malaysiensis TaxID=92644 RepID=UPI0037131B4F